MLSTVMAGLVPAIYDLIKNFALRDNSWMAGLNPAMTRSVAIIFFRHRHCERTRLFNPHPEPSRSDESKDLVIDEEWFDTRLWRGSP